MRARVRLHGAPVGELDLAGDLTIFRFDAAYLAMSERPTLGRWLEDRLSPDLVVKGPHSQLPTFFQNYLPEPSSALRELLARRAGVPPNRELTLLCALGEDLPGAVAVERMPNGDDDASASQESPPAPADPPPSGPLRFSLAGMQLKLSVLKDETHCTFPVTGVGGRWILKIPTPTFPGIAQNEYAMMRWAKRAGLTVPDVQLVRLGEVVNLPEGLANPDEQGLLVERFDRPRSGPRIHQEDFAQVLGVAPTDKYGRSAGVTYDRLGKIIATLSGPDDFEEFVRRLVFNLLCQNPDAHLKNWSFWYPDRRKPRLSPAYDLVSAVIYPGVHKELACRLANEWDPSAIRTWHFGKLASRAGFDATWGVVLAEAAATQIREAWKVLGNDPPMPEGLRASLEKHLSETKLA